MGLLKYLIPALAVTSSVQAQCSTKGTLTITNTADATKLSSCQTYTGSVAIHTKAVGDIALDGPRAITGNVVANNVGNLSSLSANNLQTIQGSFTLNELQLIQTLNFPMLTEVDTILWTALVSSLLTSLDFNAGVSKVRSLTIDATNLYNLDGLNPTTPDMVQITDNFQIQKLSLAFTKVSSLLVVRGNPLGLTLSMPKLQQAGNIQLSNVSSITIPQLESAPDGFSVSGSILQSLSLPKLKKTGAFAVYGNPNLTTLSVPELTMISDAFSVQNNTALSGTLNFPKVNYIGGATDMIGSFMGVKIPKLRSAKGPITILSTVKNAILQKTTCHTIDNLPSNYLHTLTPKCHGDIKSASQTKHLGGSHSGGGGGGGNSDTGAAGQHRASVGAVLTAFGVVAAFFVGLV